MWNSTVRARGGCGVELEAGISVVGDGVNELIIFADPAPVTLAIEVEDGKCDGVLLQLL